MREATARTEWVHVDERVGTNKRAPQKPQITNFVTGEPWSPARFAHEQIRRLVRQVFFSKGPLQVRQVVFSATDLETDVDTICAHVGVALAEETTSEIAVVGTGSGRPIRRGAPYVAGEKRTHEVAESESQGRDSLQNLWFLPAREGGAWGSEATIKTYLGDIRREFEYSILQAPPLTNSEESLSLAEYADGLILVLSAQHTRRAAALRLREMLALAQVRLLGTVLSDREFPIPEKIYRRL